MLGRKQKVKGQCHLRVRSDFTGNAAKILYGFFFGDTTDDLCVIFGKIFIIYYGKIVKFGPIEVGGRVKILLVFTLN